MLNRTVVQHTHTAKGRGVFAQQAFTKGEVVEISPVFPVRSAWEDLPEDVQRVVYEWGRLIPAQDEHLWGIALGVGSLFNHANPANLTYWAQADDQTITFVAARDIAMGEELTINYNENGAICSTEDTWFHLLGIDPL